MVFENEINIYNPDAIKNEFHTQSTQISATQGKIGAIISDSQIQELQSGKITMFDRLVSAEMDINGISTQVSSLRQADGELESQISTIRQTATEINLEVSSVKNNYAKKSQIILAINSVTQESQTVISSEHISLAGKTINLTSDNIIIKSKYFNVDKEGKISATAGTFSGELQAATGTFSGSLSAATGTFKGSLQAATGSFSGSLSAATGTFKGSLQAATGSFSGSVTASTGEIGGFTIGNNNIHNGMTSLDSSNNGVWVGIDGIALGGGRFKVTRDGNVNLESKSGMDSLNMNSGRLKFSSYYSAIGGNWDSYIYGNVYSMQFTDAYEYTFSAYTKARTSRHLTCDINYDGVHVQGELTVTGAKNRKVTTKDYGARLLYCYETPSPLFGDVGEGVISEDGKCYVFLDNIFTETVSLGQYQVFLQKYGAGECFVSERKCAYFVVSGTPGLVFGWELKAKQSDFDQYRLEKDNGKIDAGNVIDYGTALTEHIYEIQKEREVAA